MSDQFTYKDIHGWFDFHDIYTDMVENAPVNSVFVELGSWLGKSTAYMGAELKEKRHDINFFAVDVWDYLPEDEFYKKLIDEHGDIYKVFKSNMERCGVSEYVTPLRMKTLEAVNMFDDKSIEFLFIDANHNYPHVLWDIQKWLPKVKGYIGGHDYSDSIHHAGVVRAVKETFSDYKVIGLSWLVKL